MFKTLFKSPSALFYAVVVHVILVGLVVFSMDWSSVQEDEPQLNIVDAVAVDEKKILKQIEDLKKKEKQKKRKEDRRQKKLKDEALRAKKARKREEQALAKLKKSRKKEKKRLAETKKKRLTEQKMKREIIKNRKLAEKKLAKVRQEKQHLEEQTAKRKELERQRKIEELERMLKEEDRQHRMNDMAAEEAERKKQMDAESDRLSEDRQKQIQSITAKYKALIQAKIIRLWSKPASAKPGMTSTVSVRLIPSGDVIMVATIKSSGDAFYDRTVETAVHKAAPLPLPEDPDLFEHFRELIFNFSPSDDKQ